jgi:uncharacterized protein (UPF0264 family)
MTGLLASVNSLEEAIIALENKVDIIDLKQPKQGALGALDIETISQIVAHINHKCPISATIGDLPMQADGIIDAVTKIASTQVDFIKIGFFPGDTWDATVSQLASLTQQELKLIAVLFADQQPDYQILKELKAAGFTGVMLDTMDKGRGSLTQVMPEQVIKHFVEKTKHQQMLCGLAGSLRQEDIAQLLTLQPDYLGFRGAICHQHNRTSKLDKQALKSIHFAISGNPI